MIYITGAYGFIGSYLRVALHDRWYIPIDIQILDKNYINYDWSGLSSEDTIIHLAATSDVSKCEEDPELAMVNNAYGLESIPSGDFRFIFASSAAAINPQNVYGESKLKAEEIIRRRFKNHAILRFFNVVGDFAGRKDFTSIVKQAVKDGGYIDIYGPENTRDFVSVHKVVEEIIRQIDAKFICTLEVGSGKSVSLLEHAVSLGATKIRVHPPKPHDIIHSHLTI